MKTILLTIILTLAANISLASSTVGGYPACVSYDFFKQFVKAETRGDDNALTYLTSNMYCIVSKANIPISVLDRGFGWHHVRAYADNGAVLELWTNSENIK